MSDTPMCVKDIGEQYLANDAEPSAPAGYQRTDAGVIPEGWDVQPLSRFCTFSNGVNADKRAYGTGIPFVNVLEAITYSHLRSRDIQGKVNLPEHLIELFRVRRGDVVFNRTSEVPEEVGLAAVYCDTERVVFGGFVIRARLSGNVLSTDYAGYGLRAPVVRAQIVAKAQGAVRANIGQQSLGSVLVPVPTDTEQRDIAEALSDLDSLLESFDRLIAKKRSVKLAAMQKLLTGETRLPGFSEEWQSRKLGEHLKFLRNGTNSRAELSYESPIKYLHYGDIHTFNQVRLDPTSKQLPSLNHVLARRLDRLEDGDLVFADASEDLEGVGKSVEISNSADTEVVSGLHTIAVRFDSAILAHGFKAYLQYVPSFVSQLRKLAAGTKVYATTRSHIAAVEMRLPEHDEQVAIAQVLSDMDADIDALVGRRDKTQTLKQGMMQQLLTGRTRLIKPDATVAV